MEIGFSKGTININFKYIFLKQGGIENTVCFCCFCKKKPDKQTKKKPIEIKSGRGKWICPLAICHGMTTWTIV